MCVCIVLHTTSIDRVDGIDVNKYALGEGNQAKKKKEEKVGSACTSSNMHFWAMVRANRSLTIIKREQCYKLYNTPLVVVGG